MNNVSISQNKNLVNIDNDNLITEDDVKELVLENLVFAEESKMDVYEVNDNDYDCFNNDDEMEYSNNENVKKDNNNNDKKKTYSEAFDSDQDDLPEEDRFKNKKLKLN